MFTLTLSQYIELATQTGYADGKGKTAQSLSLDRIDPAHGYEPGNLRVVTLQENSRLRWAPLPAHLRAAYQEVCHATAH